MIGIIGSAISFSIFLTGNSLILPSTVENKLDYETIIFNNDEKAILAIFDNDKYLIVDYNVDNIGNAIFNTDNYMLIPVESVSVTYTSFSSVNIIK